MKMSFLRPVALVALAAYSSACGTLSVAEEKRIGAAQQRQIRQSFGLLRDRVVVDYVRKLGDELAKASQTTPFELRFYVVEDESLNAFATFGGAIYINTGIISVSNDVSELAGVIAHEIGHVTARHLAKNAKRQQNTGILAQIAAFAIAIVSGSSLLARGGQMLTEMSAVAYLNTFSREFESEADALAIETLIKAGYDPEGMVRLFRTFQAEAGGGGGIRFLQDHPTNEERIDAVQAAIVAAGSPEGKSEDRGRLEIIQERIKLVAGTDTDVVDEEEDEEEVEEEEEE
jgi:beta-barrel assembly-enhancing protease